MNLIIKIKVKIKFQIDYIEKYKLMLLLDLV